MGKRDENGTRTTKKDKSIKTRQRMGPYSIRSARIATQQSENGGAKHGQTKEQRGRT